MIIQFNAKLTPEMNEKFIYVCEHYNISKSAFLFSCIEQEYDALKGNPKLNDMLEQMQNFAKSLQDFSSGQEPKK